MIVSRAGVSHFRRSVHRRAACRPKHGAALDEFSEPEICDLDNRWFMTGEEDVRWFEIAVSDALAVDILFPRDDSEQ